MENEVSEVMDSDVLNMAPDLYGIFNNRETTDKEIQMLHDLYEDYKVDGSRSFKEEFIWIAFAHRMPNEEELQRLRTIQAECKADPHNRSVVEEVRKLILSRKEDEE